MIFVWIFVGILVALVVGWILFLSFVDYW